MESLRQESGFLNVKTAVQTALDYVKQLYETEDIRNLGLEEVKLAGDEESWLITVGFSRPWSQSNRAQTTFYLGDTPPPQPLYPLERDYKQVRIDARSGEVRGMEIRKL